jgi:putative ABC transport system permease protein
VFVGSQSPLWTINRDARRPVKCTMISIARKNLLHDRIRFIAALVGIQFAVTLMTIQIGFLLKFMFNASVLIDNFQADLWITSKNLKNFDFGLPFSDTKANEAKRVNGVLWAEKSIMGFSYWRMPDGGQETIQVIGFNPETLVGAPWDVVEGDLKDVKYFNHIFIDQADRERLGNPQIGDEVEIIGRTARVAGITRGAKSFTGSPFAFTSFKNAIELSFVQPGETVYILVKVAPGYSVDEVKARLAEVITGVDVYTKTEFSWKSRKYWMLITGAGIALLSTALMGLIIGTIIVGQTIYASTIEHIKEFGTLKAIGATNGDIYRIIIEQALIIALVGFATGMIISKLALNITKKAGLEAYLPWEVLAALFIITVAMCVGSSVVSIFKITKLDPALVFKT